MPDYTIPLQVQTPNMLGALGNMVNTAAGIQSLQTGQIQQQRLGINLQSEVQANQERKSVIAAMANDPDLQPDPSTGLVDPAKATTKLQQLAPQTWSYYTGNINTHNQATTKTNDMLIGLDQDARQALARITASHVGQKDPSSLVNDINDWMDNTKGPQAKQLGNDIISRVGKIGNNSQAYDAFLKTASLRAESVPNIIAARQAGVSTIASGGKIQAAATAPNWSGTPQMAPVGEAIQTTLGPEGIEKLETDPVSGQAVIVRRSPQGAIISSRPAAGLPAGGGGTSGPAPAQGGFTQVPPGETVQTMSQLQQMRQGSNLAARQAGEIASNNKQILDLLKGGATATGSNAPFVKKWMGSIGLQWTNDEATNLDRISHFLALQQQANEKAMGVSTDAGREVSGLASGGIQMTGPALASAVKANDALTTGVKVFNTGLEKSIASGGVGAARTFQNQWAQAFDPVVYRYANAIRDGDTAEKARIEKQYGKGTPAWSGFVARMQALHSLETNGAQ
jgi:hypothetical protein